MSEPHQEGRPARANTAHDARCGWLPVAAWCSYDWANSAFSTVITTFIFSVYFTQAVAASPVEGTVLWSRAVTVAGLAGAIVSPFLGAVADFSGPRKPWLFAFTAACATLTAGLWFVQPFHGVRLSGLAGVCASIDQLPVRHHLLRCDAEGHRTPPDSRPRIGLGLVCRLCRRIGVPRIVILDRSQRRRSYVLL